MFPSAPSPRRVVSTALAWLTAGAGFVAFSSAAQKAATIPTGSTRPPDVLVILAEGTGFPFEDPGFARYEALRRLRQSGRPFDATFASDAAWTETTSTLLAGTRGRGVAGLVAAFEARRYVTSLVTPSGAPAFGFDRAVKAAGAEVAQRLLDAVDAKPSRPVFAFATMDLRNVPATGPAPSIDAPPIESPAIALSDRAPLDPVRFAVTPPPRDSAARSALAARRHGAWTALDREVAALIGGLERRGALSNTIIALVSAGPAPRPERAAPPREDLLFEDWLRGLLVIQSPALAAPGVPSTSLAVIDDIAPTLAGLAGVPLVKGYGVDLSPSVRDPRQATRASLLSSAERQAPRIGRSVRTAQYRYTLWPDGSEELFDEEADPHEWTNLAAAPSMQTRKAELAKRLALPGSPAPARPARPAAARRPNVVMIIGDDLTSQYPQFGDVKTPNLDRLRARGRVFERAFAPAPFCVPSRAAFLSGMSPARLELQHDNPYPDVFTARVPLLQEQFRANGYFTASVGKVWDSQPGEKRGWDLNEWQPPLPAGITEAAPRLIAKLPVDAGPTDNPDEVEGDGRRARFAVKVLGESRDQPLFLALGLVRPHVAWVAPQKYFDMYPPSAIRFTPAPAGDAGDIPAIAIKNRPQSLPGLMLSGREPAGFSDNAAEARASIAAYLACVTFMDAQLGLVLDELDKGDRWKDTIVVLFGDNGHHFGDHGGLWRKNTLFEESLRVPMIIAAPGLTQPGVATRSLADLLDLYPTLVELTGIARPGTLDGTSLVPLLADPKASVQDALVQYRPAEPPKTGYSLRTARYRYTLWPDGSEELYDVTVDPAGRKDLARQPAVAATLRTLRRQIEAQVP